LRGLAPARSALVWHGSTQNTAVAVFAEIAREHLRETGPPRRE
jgi:hypothetical protein